MNVVSEDPYNDFRPSPGKITTHMPGGHGVRSFRYACIPGTIPPNMIQ
jgi:acetyl-CoA carboxylase biotin carboxylase subunit